MEIRNARRAWALGAMAIAMVLAMASTAVACTVYRGKMTVNATGFAASGSASADGNGSNHGFCGTHPRGVLQTAGAITVTISAATSCTSSLPDATYKVWWVNHVPTESFGPTSTGNLQVDGATDPEFYNCNNTSQAQNTLREQLGTISVSSGNGSANFDLAAAGALPGPGGICANDGSGVVSTDSAPQVYITWI